MPTGKVSGRLQAPLAAAAALVLLAVAGCACGGSAAHPPTERSTGPSPPATVGRVVRQIAVGSEPDGVVAGFGSLWTANLGSNTVSRVDPGSGRVVATIQAGAGPISLLVAGGRIWVADYNGSTVERIDPGDNRVVARIHVGSQPVSMVQVGATVWVLNQADETASLVGLQGLRAETTVHLQVGSGFAAFSGGLLWVPDFKRGSSRVVAIDPRTRRIVRRLRVAGGSPLQAGFGLGGGWVGNGPGDAVTPFDPTSGSVRSVVRLKADAGGLIVTPHSVWVASYLGDVLTRIAPSGRIEGTVKVGSEPNGIASYGGRLWVTESGAGELAEVAPEPADRAGWP